MLYHPCTHPILVQQLRYRYIHIQLLYNNLGIDIYTSNPCTTTQVQICKHQILVQQLRYRYVHIQPFYNNSGTDMYTPNRSTTTQVQICTHSTLVQQLRYRYVHFQPLYNNSGTNMYTSNSCTTTQVQICKHPILVQQLRYRYVHILFNLHPVGPKRLNLKKAVFSCIMKWLVNKRYYICFLHISYFQRIVDRVHKETYYYSA